MQTDKSINCRITYCYQVVFCHWFCRCFLFLKSLICNLKSDSDYNTKQLPPPKTLLPLLSFPRKRKSRSSCRPSLLSRIWREDEREADLSFNSSPSPGEEDFVFQVENG